jgi:hypothetical protein
VFLTLSFAVPTVLPPALAVKTTLHEPDLLPHVTTYVPREPVTVAIPPDEQALSLKLKALPFGPEVFTVAFGLDHDRLREHGLTETPWSTAHFAGWIGMPNDCICEAPGGRLDEAGGVDPALAQPARRPATARAAKGRRND